MTIEATTTNSAITLSTNWGLTSTAINYTDTNFWAPSTYYPFVQTVYTPYWGYWNTEDKISKAFKLVQKLMEKNLITPPATIKDFIELVNSISEIL